MSSTPIERLHRMQGTHGELAVYAQGPQQAPAVLMTHSILSSSAMWDMQAALLAPRYRVVRFDTIGHGNSAAPSGPVTMDGLATDAVAVLDALGIAQAHHVGLSLGGMSGFGLALRHPGRLISQVLCATRADAPPAVAAPWDERIAAAETAGSCEPLAAPTVARWFGPAFVADQPACAQRFERIAGNTSVAGFVGCARAIQGLDYLGRVADIRLPTTLIVGSRDGALPEAMAALQALIPGAVLETIADAGHLPNVDQRDAFDAALQRHFERLPPPSTPNP